jgi:hypothetical protein
MGPIMLLLSITDNNTQQQRKHETIMDSYTTGEIITAYDSLKRQYCPYTCRNDERYYECDGEPTLTPLEIVNLLGFSCNSRDNIDSDGRGIERVTDVVVYNIDNIVLFKNGKKWKTWSIKTALRQMPELQKYIEHYEPWSYEAAACGF